MKKVFIFFCFLMMSSVLLAGEVFRIEKATIIKEDLVLIGKSCVIDGTVRGDAVIINGNLELNGTIEGDAVVLGGEAIVNGQSHVKGDLVIVGGNLTKAEGAFVDGEVVITSLGPFKNLFKLIPSVTQFSTEQGEVNIEKDDKIKPICLSVINRWGNMGFASSWMFLVWGIALSIVIMLFTAIFQSSAETMTLYLEKKQGHCFWAGFLAQILYVPALIFLVISILGIPLIPLFTLAYPIALLIGLVPTSLFIGKRITKSSPFFQSRNCFSSFIGLFILFVLFFIGEMFKIGNCALAVLGNTISSLTFLILYLYFTFGLGCLILSRLGTRKP